MIDLRADMLADLNLEQQNNTNIQIRLLQIKHEFEQVWFILNKKLLSIYHI